MTDNERNNRIEYEIIVDCYNKEEIFTAWHIYLSENLVFPFKAYAPIKKRGQAAEHLLVEVVEFEEKNEKTPSVGVVTENYSTVIYVPILALTQITEANEQTLTAIEDWQYWNQ